MKRLRLMLVASCIALTVSVNAFAGDMNCGFIPPPPPPPQTQSVSGTESSSATVGNGGITYQNTTSGALTASYAQIFEVYGRALMTSLDFGF